MIRSLEDKLGSTFHAVVAIAGNLQNMLGILQRLSQDLAEYVISYGYANVDQSDLWSPSLSSLLIQGSCISQKILDIHSMVKSILRAIEAIPLHLTLPLIRVDDAFGWPCLLPLEACQTYEVYHNLRSLVSLITGFRDSKERSKF